MRMWFGALVWTLACRTQAPGPASLGYTTGAEEIRVLANQHAPTERVLHAVETVLERSDTRGCGLPADVAGLRHSLAGGALWDAGLASRLVALIRLGLVDVPSGSLTSQYLLELAGQSSDLEAAQRLGAEAEVADDDVPACARRAMLRLALGTSGTVGGLVKTLETLGSPRLTQSIALLKKLPPDITLSSLSNRPRAITDLGNMLTAHERPTPSAAFGACRPQNLDVSIALETHIAGGDDLEVARGLSLTEADVAVQVKPTAADGEIADQRLTAWIAEQSDRTLVGVLAREWDRHCVWLIDETGVVATNATLIPSIVVDALHASLRHAWGVDNVGDARAPTLRALEPLAPDRAHLDLATAEAAEQLAAALLPGTTRSHVREYDHLVVVPYGGLGTVPFPGLPADEDGDGALVDHVSVSIAPSVDAFSQHVVGGTRWADAHRAHCALDQAPTVNADPAAMVIGDPTTNDPDWVLPPLDGARREALAVAEALDAKAMIGLDADVASVRASAPAADVLYVAAHGVARPGDPLSGFLALSGGRWTADEIQSSCLDRASLAVLSACQTGLGGLHEAGVIGVARAFHLAGVDQVVMSLWSVDDQATAALMQSFAAKMASEWDNDRYAASRVLRSAMLELRKHRPEPRYWASFLVFGVRPKARG